MHDPLSEIADVDELDCIIRRSRHEHLASAIKPHGPIGEPPRWVLWTYNQSGPANKGVLTYRLLTRDLGGAIGLLGTVLDLQGCGRPEEGGICPVVRLSAYTLTVDTKVQCSTRCLSAATARRTWPG